MHVSKKRSGVSPAGASVFLPSWVERPELGRLEIDAAAALRWIGPADRLGAREIGALFLALLHVGAGEDVETAVRAAVESDVGAPAETQAFVRAFLGDVLGEAA